LVASSARLTALGSTSMSVEFETTKAKALARLAR